MKAEKTPALPTTLAGRQNCRNKNGRPITTFQYRVYDLCSQIPAGYFSTYKELSDALKSSPRAVGQALKINPFAPNVPCHRVLASNFFVGGFCGQWGSGEKINKKVDLLQNEGLLLEQDGFIAKDMQSSRIFRDFQLISQL